MILYVNACVREGSRTARLASALLAKLGGEYRERRLAEERLSPLSAAALQARDERIAKRDYADASFALAKEFAAADVIVIAAPFWDLSFPALLKVYLENIYVTGIVSEYTDAGIPHGLCRAKRLFYVTTAGGPYLPDFSYDLIRRMATEYFGIPETRLICAEMLDVRGYDAEEILEKAIRSL